MLRRMFGSNRDDVTGEWRRRHKEELCELCSPPNIIQVIKPIIIIIIIPWAGHVARMGERCAYRVLVGKPEGRRPLERPRHRWESIKVDLQEVAWGHALG